MRPAPTPTKTSPGFHGAASAADPAMRNAAETIKPAPNLALLECMFPPPAVPRRLITRLTLRHSNTAQERGALAVGSLGKQVTRPGETNIQEYDFLSENSSDKFGGAGFSA